MGDATSHNQIHLPARRVGATRTLIGLDQEQWGAATLVAGGVLAMLGMWSGSDELAVGSFGVLAGGAAATLGLFALRSADKPPQPGEKAQLAFEMLEVSGDSYILSDGLGIILRVNPAAQELAQRFCGAEPPSQMQSVLGFDPSADAKIFQLMRAALTDGAARGQFFRSGEAAERGVDVSITRPSADSEILLWRLTLATPERPPEPEAPLELALAELLAEAPVGFFSTDRSGAILTVNDALRQWIGSSSGSDPRVLSDLFLEGADRLSPAMLKVGESLSGPAMLRAAGGPKPVEVTQRLIESGDEEEFDGPVALGFVMLARQKRLTAKAAQSMRLARLFDSAPFAIAMTDLSGAILEMNNVLARLSSGAARKGALLELAVGVADRAEFREQLAMVAEGRTLRGPVDIALPGESEERAGQVFLNRVQTDEGDAVLAFIVDVTEQKQLEVQFAQAQRLQGVGQLAGGVAHDFNNLLTAIMGHCDLLMHRSDASDPGFRDVQQIQSNAKRAANLVSKLLAFSRRQKLSPEIVQLTDLLAETSHALNRVLGERVELKLVHGRDLWPVKVDRTEFDTIILNLVVNARDAMPDGGVVSLRTQNLRASEVKARDHELMAPHDYVLIEVADTGTGISKEHLGRIFEPFFTTKTEKNGTGLGLSSVYGLIKAMDGFIFPESEVGKGTVFRIYLPRQRASDAVPIAKKGDDEDTPRDLSGKGLILLVEDEDAVRSFAARALQLRGYKVLEAASGEAALEVIQSQGSQINLVISDVVMPNMDGPSLMRRIRETNPSIKVLFISGYAEDAFRKNLKGDEEFLFLPKPFSLKALALKAKQALAS